MKMEFLLIGDTKSDYLRKGIAEYSARINRYVAFGETVIPEDKKWRKMDAPTRKMAEAKALEACLRPGDLLILLDERGKGYTSAGFAEFLQKKMNAGPKRLLFAIGGPYGFDRQVHSLSQGSVSLSKMTFSHEMVRLFAAEQIYRALTILNNEPYHNP